ncbi:serine hydrolase domain-containing protein [Ottowia thiooxydans]|uniref:CubicO group peptidase (Beta-lactamase class C family) n=1 Tax=Ottowia thiooxydans TaxID=219182 RepID=A0ABV2Q9K3_9BURK
MRLLLLGFALWLGVSTSAQALEDIPHDVVAELNHKLPVEYPGVRSLVIQRHGKLILEYYRNGLNAATLHDARFATASVVSTLVGIAIHQGKIKSTAQPLSDFLPSANDPAADRRVRAITVGQILTLTAGFDPSVKQVGRWAFPVDFALQRALVSQPGAAFSFNPGTAHLAARILASATKQRLTDFARKNLFTPLGIDRFLWRIDGPGGSELGYTGLELTTRDMSKIG